MMKTASRYLAAGAAATCLFCLTSAGAKQKTHAKAHVTAHPAASSASADSGDWTPNSLLLSKLAPETPFDVYALRLPTALTLVDKSTKPVGDETLNQYTYAGQKRSDSTFPIITIMTLSNLPASIASGGQAQLNRLLDNVEHETTDGKPNLVMSSREYGEVNGLPVVREYFKFSYEDGQDKNTPLMHGFYYACIRGTSAILFNSLDAEPYNKASLPVAEAAALTLHKP